MDVVYKTLTENWILIVPELVLLAVATANVLGGFYIRGRGAWACFALLGLLLAGYLLIAKVPERFPSHWVSSASLFMTDELRWLLRCTNFIIGGTLTLIFWGQIADDYAAEFYSCLLGMIAGVGVVIAAYDLVVLFLALETVSIPTYIALYVLRRDNSGLEATIKYFLLSVLASSVFVFGVSLLYAETGRTNYLQIQLALSESVNGGYLLLSGVLIMGGLSFRIAAVPLHFYAPDVFAGTHPAGAALLAVVPKTVGLAAIMQLLMDIYGSSAGLASDGLSVVQVLLLTAGILAGASMLLGNVVGLLQNELYRLLAYSSIAHAGYMLVGLAAGAEGDPVSGYAAVVFYLGTYIAMSLGVFAGLLCVRQDGKLLGYIDELAGLGQQRPVLALFLALSLFSLTGLPPTMGFWGKVNLFLAAWYAPSGQNLLRYLAVFLAINAAIGAWYYLRVIGVMYLRQPIKPFDKVEDAPALGACVFCTILTITLFFQPQWWWEPIERAFTAKQSPTHIGTSR